MNTWSSSGTTKNAHWFLQNILASSISIYKNEKEKNELIMGGRMRPRRQIIEVETCCFFIFSSFPFRNPKTPLRTWIFFNIIHSLSISYWFFISLHTIYIRIFIIRFHSFIKEREREREVINYLDKVHSRVIVRHRDNSSIAWMQRKK